MKAASSEPEVRLALEITYRGTSDDIQMAEVDTAAKEMFPALIRVERAMLVASAVRYALAQGWVEFGEFRAPDGLPDIDPFDRTWHGVPGTPDEIYKRVFEGFFNPENLWKRQAIMLGAIGWVRSLPDGHRVAAAYGPHPSETVED